MNIEDFRDYCLSLPTRTDRHGIQPYRGLPERGRRSMACDPLHMVVYKADGEKKEEKDMV